MLHVLLGLGFRVLSFKWCWIPRNTVGFWGGTTVQVALAEWDATRLFVAELAAAKLLWWSLFPAGFALYKIL